MPLPDLRSDWRGPSTESRLQAARLQAALEDSRQQIFGGCTHSNPAEAAAEKSARDIGEVVASNDMYHLAGMVHLQRRVLGRPMSDPEVQSCVKGIVAALGDIRRGSSTEGSLLFPMFTAGCDALDQSDRDLILERLQGVEGWGMTHVSL